MPRFELPVDKENQPQTLTLTKTPTRTTRSKGLAARSTSGLSERSIPPTTPLIETSKRPLQPTTPMVSPTNPQSLTSTAKSTRPTKSHSKLPPPPSTPLLPPFQDAHSFFLLHLPAPTTLPSYLTLSPPLPPASIPLLRHSLYTTITTNPPQQTLTPSLNFLILTLLSIFATTPSPTTLKNLLTLTRRVAATHPSSIHVQLLLLRVLFICR